MLGGCITDKVLCAKAGGKDACQNYSGIKLFKIILFSNKIFVGGPLVTSGKGDGKAPGKNYELIGIVRGAKLSRNFCKSYKSNALDNIHNNERVENLWKGLNKISEFTSLCVSLPPATNNLFYCQAQSQFQPQLD